jgi:sugar lactone lactonase YvrE
MASVAAVAIVGACATSAAWAVAYTPGDVFADVGGGIIKEFTPAGVLVQSLNDTHSGEGDGMAFDANGNLYATAGVAANTVVKFNNSGTLDRQPKCRSARGTLMNFAMQGIVRAASVLRRNGRPSGD